jgi:GH35 family endo-1,4-beta-xylanase
VYFTYANALQALGWAQKYGTPDMKFYFSENSLYIPTKAQPVMKAYRKLRKAGYKIDGVFLQVCQWRD